MSRTTRPAWLLTLAACGGSPTEVVDLGPPQPETPAAVSPPRESGGTKINPRLLRRFQPIRADLPSDAVGQARVALGKQLFFDPRLSRDGDLSCNSCHPLDRGGVDGRPTSIGTSGARGARNAPTVYNASHHATQFWDGRAANLEDQAKGPLLARAEMGMLEPKRLTARLRAIPGYAPAFAAAFPEDKSPVDFRHATKALAAFERTLITPGRWDQFLAGESSALTADEIEGMKVFADLGCVQCHTGDLIGGLMFQRAGVARPWPNQNDQGRYEITGVEADRMVFKVPSLRNVTLTAPYFHDGSVADLDEAIEMMGTHQLGIEITPQETRAIRTWFNSLAGDPPTRMIAPPELPPVATSSTRVVRK